MFSNHRNISLAVVGGLLVFGCVVAYPVSTTYTHTLSLALLPGLLLAIVVLTYRMRLARILFVTGALAIAGLLLVPGRGVHDTGLAERYATELLRYSGTRYVWGGENRLGIDCSGLVRSALVNAAISRGVETANPSLLRFGLSLWWHDRTAQQLGEGYRGETIPVTILRSVNASDVSDLRVGDLAVTVSGVHVLAYAGNRTWVEADPAANTVLVVRAPEAANPWFNVPVRIVRWRVLTSAI